MSAVCPECMVEYDEDDTNVQEIEFEGSCYWCRHCDTCEVAINAGETWCDSCRERREILQVV